MTIQDVNQPLGVHSRTTVNKQIFINAIQKSISHSHLGKMGLTDGPT